MARETLQKTTGSSKKASPKVKASGPGHRSRSIRFQPDPDTLAELGVRLTKSLGVTLFGLVANESRGGCALVLHTEVKLKEGLSCVVRVGRLPDARAEIRWVKELDKNLVKVGLEYVSGEL